MYRMSDQCRDSHQVMLEITGEQGSLASLVNYQLNHFYRTIFTDYDMLN